MQKTSIGLVIAGALIVIGLMLLVVGNQIILEGVSQGSGIVSSNQPLTVEGNFETEETDIGVFAVQVMEYKDNTYSARIFDPRGIEIITTTLQEETTEEDFEIRDSGIYKLVIESNEPEEVQVFGAIGPLPDAGKKSLGFISMYIVIAGMVGLVSVGVYGIKKRKRSV